MKVPVSRWKVGDSWWHDDMMQDLTTTWQLVSEYCHIAVWVSGEETLLWGFVIIIFICFYRPRRSSWTCMGSILWNLCQCFLVLCFVLDEEEEFIHSWFKIKVVPPKGRNNTQRVNECLDECMKHFCDLSFCLASKFLFTRGGVTALIRTLQSQNDKLE